jgi:tRNA A37 threonylcarbamoyladenosine synthetase subunit TsaC/SUA5/YrdC
MNTKIEVDAARIYDLLADGGLALARTNTGYGLVAMKSDAVRRIYALKGRPEQKPCVTVGTLSILDDVSTGIDPETRDWLSQAISRWPMAVIARTNRKSELLRSFEPFVAAQCTKADTIATFFGVGELIARTATLARAHGQLIVGSSANLAGTGNNYTLDAVPDAIRNAVDLELDYGAAPFASDRKLASTILDLTKGTFQREGVSFAQVEESWQLFLSERRSHGFGPSSTPRSQHGAQDAR